MAASPKYIAELIYRHLNGTITAAEAAALQLWLKESPENERFLSAVTDEDDLADLVLFDEQYEQTEMKRSLYKTISSRLSFSDPSAIKPVQLPVHRVHFLRRWGWAAACVLFILSLSVYFRIISDRSDTSGDLLSQGQDIQPGSSSAFLRLADGSRVLLDSLQYGVAAMQGNTQLIRDSNDHITYRQDNKQALSDILYNTLTNPRGSRVVSIVLQDGSRVWLNAGSVLTYPTAFTGNSRQVTLTGEAYFEVAHRASMPFIVNRNALAVTVLGTHFNVMAYEDDNAIKVTLLEGSVRVDKGILTGVLQPGQQAVVAGDLRVIKDADIEQAIAWKEGFFQFNKTSIDDVLREAARWYDIDIIYEGQRPTDTFTGGITRSSSLSELLTILQMNRVHFRLEGRKLVVLNGPQNK
ncbi:MAG: FecR domain-containing protein [Niastella sp.]|nr:FecR domain-containing protein [Niastella sp.]